MKFTAGGKYSLIPICVSKKCWKENCKEKHSKSFISVAYLITWQTIIVGMFAECVWDFLSYQFFSIFLLPTSHEPTQKAKTETLLRWVILILIIINSLSLSMSYWITEPQINRKGCDFLGEFFYPFSKYNWPEKCCRFIMNELKRNFTITSICISSICKRKQKLIILIPYDSTQCHNNA